MNLTYLSSFLSVPLLLGTIACGGTTGGSDSSTGGASSGGASSGGTSSPSTGGSNDGSCVVDGKTYADGESFKSDCNTCTCQKGEVGCTLIGCLATCGGFAGKSCGDGEFCLYDDEASCGAGDGAGTCRDVPNACTDDLAPVCGCDGKTYSNTCQAHSEGVNIASDGECAQP